MSELLACCNRDQAQWDSCVAGLEATKFLPFKLKDYYRSTWVNDTAKSVWQSRIQRVSEAWKAIELLAVVKGMRECCLIMLGEREFLAQAKRWVDLGLAFSPIGIYGVPKDGYASTVVEVEDGKPVQFRFVVGQPNSVREVVRAFELNDNAAVGMHLGYPECCRRFFTNVWVKRNLVDTSWAMALNSQCGSQSENRVTVDNVDWRANILWRWMGVRPVFHLPCSFDCQCSIDVARGLIEIGENEGYKQEMMWLEEILSWPVQWTALHGIAEIKTPIMKVSTRTDATAFKLTVQVQGRRYPDEGAVGLSFPFNHGNPVNRFTATESFRRGLDNPIVQLAIPPRVSEARSDDAGERELTCEKPGNSETGPQGPTWLAADNGFNSKAVMDQHHGPIVRLVSKLLLEEDLKSVIDLGCGNGVLLARIREECNEIIPFGIDSNKTAIDHARIHHAFLGSSFFAGNMFEKGEVWSDDKHYDLALLMPGRLTECTAEQARQLRRLLHLRCKRIVAYAYGDWLGRYRGLTNLLDRTGLSVIGMIASSPGVSVEVAIAEVAVE